MAAQLSLFEPRSRPAPPPRDRDVVFFAALLGPQLAEAVPLIVSLRTRFGVTETALARERWHISLIGVGFRDELTEDQLAIARHVAGSFVVTPSELVFDEVLTLARRPTGRKLAIVLRSTEAADTVRQLACELAEAMIAEGFDPRGLPTAEPHLTLIYDTAFVPPAPIAPIRVRLDSVSLICSHRGKTRYTVLGSTPAAQAAGASGVLST